MIKPFSRLGNLCKFFLLGQPTPPTPPVSRVYDGYYSSTDDSEYTTTVDCLNASSQFDPQIDLLIDCGE